MRQGGGKKLRLLSSATVLMVSLSVLAGCTSTPQTASVEKKKRSKEYFAESIYGVKASPRVSNKRTKLPRGGGRDQTGKPYQVRGKWYYPKEDKDYRKVGAASWYGDAFHGRLTANGEIYDMTHLTAAHPTMPLPSYARVTNLKNGDSIIVRVNDRGPYDSGRIIDLSHKAADMLGYTTAGTTKVEVEYVGRAPLDGHDDSYLMASYRPAGRVPDPSADGLPSGVMIAMNGSTPSAAPRRAAAPMPISEPEAAPLPAVRPAPRRAPEPSTLPAAETPSGERLVWTTMSYAAQEPQRATDAFKAFDRAAPDTYVAAATFKKRRDALALAERLGRFGAAEVESAGKAYSVTLRYDGRLTGDDLLRAAWENGAPDAMTVREDR